MQRNRYTFNRQDLNEQEKRLIYVGETGGDMPETGLDRGLDETDEPTETTEAPIRDSSRDELDRSVPAVREEGEQSAYAAMNGSSGPGTQLNAFRQRFPNAGRMESGQREASRQPALQDRLGETFGRINQETKIGQQINRVADHLNNPQITEAFGQMDPARQQRFLSRVGDKVNALKGIRSVDDIRTAVDILVADSLELKLEIFNSLSPAEQRAIGPVVRDVLPQQAPEQRRGPAYERRPDGRLNEDEGRAVHIESLAMIPINGEEEPEHNIYYPDRVSRIAALQEFSQQLQPYVERGTRGSGIAKDMIDQAIDSLQRGEEPREAWEQDQNQPQESQESTSGSPQDRLKAKIGESFTNRSRAKQQQLDRIFEGFDDARAEAMITVFDGMNSTEQQNFLQVLKKQVNVISKMPPHDLQKAVDVISAPSAQKAEHFRQLSPRSQMMFNRMGDASVARFIQQSEQLAARSQAEAQREMQIAAQQMDQVIAASVPAEARGQFPRGVVSPQFANDAMGIIGQLDEQAGRAFQGTMEQIASATQQAREVAEGAVEAAQEQGEEAAESAEDIVNDLAEAGSQFLNYLGRGGRPTEQMKQQAQQMRDSAENTVARGLHEALSRNPDVRAKMETAKRAKLAVEGGVDGKGDMEALDKFAQDYLKSGDAEWYEEAYAFVNEDGFREKVRERVGQEYNKEIEGIAEQYNVTPEFVEKVVLSPDFDPKESQLG